MAISKLAQRRMTKLIDFMDALPRSAVGHFNMKAWIKHNGNHDHKFGKFIKPRDVLTCGTTACALGWATAVPAFKNAGLRVLADRGFDSNQQNLSEAQRFFDLDRPTAVLFFGYSDEAVCPEDTHPTRHVRTPKQWAKSAKKLLRQLSAE